MKLIRPFTVTAANLTSNVAEDGTYPEYAVSATYALGAIVIETVGPTASHHAYESLVAGNVGNPLTNAAKWLDLGATNRFAMFDQSNGSATTNATSIDASIAVTGRADGLALLNLDAQTVDIEMNVASPPHTNLALYSGAHNGPSWSVFDSVVIEDSQIGPSGRRNADKFTGTGTGPTVLRQNITTGAPYFTMSHELAPGTATSAHMATNGLGLVAHFDLIAGVATLVMGTACGMDKLENGFYRCWVTVAQTPTPISIGWILGPTSVFDVTTTDSLYVGNSQFEEASAPSARIVTTSAPVTSSISEIYSQTFNLQSDSGVSSWYDYFSEEIIFATDLVLTDLPLYTSPIIRAVINKTGTASCGNMIVGQGRELGDVVYGARVGIADYSRKTVDDFGNYTLVERSFAKRTSFKIVIPNTQIDQMQTLLAGYRATPVMWIGTDQYAATWVFGFYKDFSIEIAFVEKSNVTLEIEGLT